MFKKILKLGVAAVALYYAYQTYEVYYNPDDITRDGFFNKKFDRKLARGEYDVIPSPTKPAPERLVGGHNPAKVKALMEYDPYLGTGFLEPDYSSPWCRERTPEEQKQANAEAQLRALKSDYNFLNPTRADLYDRHRCIEIYKNCVQEPLKGGYGYHVTCCEGWKKTVIRGVAYWGHMTMAEATRKVEANTDKDGDYATDIYVYERHYADCPKKGKWLSQKLNQPGLYVEQDIPDSLAYASRKTPSPVQQVAERTPPVKVYTAGYSPKINTGN